MFSWLKISAVLPMLPLTKTIFVCISSWKEAFGRAMTMPLALNGNGPLYCSWKWVMSSCMSMIALLVALRAAAMPEDWYS